MKDDIILQVENLHTGFLVDNVPLEAVSGVSFSLKAGRVLGVVGESGCGKSVTAHSIMQLLPKYGRITEGSITSTVCHAPLGIWQPYFASAGQG